MMTHGRNTNGHDRHIVLTAREIGRVHQAFAEDVRRQQRSEVFRQVRAVNLSGQSVRAEQQHVVGLNRDAAHFGKRDVHAHKACQLAAGGVIDGFGFRDLAVVQQQLNDRVIVGQRL